ncbi:MAG: hypothetical protein IKE43_04680 [Coriobacteriales bacterium]|nr:hypothetical protein [Coriobacteriales bacterium]
MQTMSRRDLLKGMALACGSAALPIAASQALATESVDEAEEQSEYIQAGGYTLIPYTQYASGGIKTDVYAVILFENSNSTFTKYQVAYTSCTCRDAASNYRSVMYVELLNTKPTAEEATIRWITYGENDGYIAGFWGDSNPVHGRPDYTAEYMEENFVAKLVKHSKADFDAWGGYGTQIEGIDTDAVAGATVSTSNITSVLQALFAYHAAKYYNK